MSIEEIVTRDAEANLTGTSSSCSLIDLGPNDRASGLGGAASIASSISATSRTLRAIGPPASRLQLSGTTPASGTSPWVGRSPDKPQKDAGMRIEPPVSLPVARGIMRPESAVPNPELNPPGRAGQVPWVSRIAKDFHTCRTQTQMC